jgi:hypothetical protein
MQLGMQTVSSSDKVPDRHACVRSQHALAVFADSQSSDRKTGRETDIKAVIGACNLSMKRKLADA